MARSRVIEAPRLRLEPFSEAHLTARYLGWLSDPEVVRYSDQRRAAHTRESCDAYRRSFDGTPNYFWAIVARDASLGHFGTMTAYVEPTNGVADMGILIGERAAWGQGLGSETWLAACGFLFLDLGLRKITAGTIEPNQGMLGIMRKTGMKEDGRRVRQHLWEGRPVDVIHAALFREDWKG